MKKENPLNPEILCSAYVQGFFPMPDVHTGEIRWYRPDPRAIIPLDGFHLSHSMRRHLHRGIHVPTFDQDFSGVMKSCANRKETWIDQNFLDAYAGMHTLGLAHSVEVWNNKAEGERTLVGGVYGVSIGGAFFAESMFHKETNASKVALYYLVERMKEKGFLLLECQFLTSHLCSLGALEIPDKEYRSRLQKAMQKRVYF